MKPDLQEYKKIAGASGFVPIVRELIADTETPVSAFRKIAYGADGHPLPFSFLLESVEGGEKIGRYSFLGTDPLAVFTSEAGKAILKGRNGELSEIDGSDVFEKIDQLMARYKVLETEGLPPFFGGAVGYLSYDCAGEAEPSIPMPSALPYKVPDALFMVMDTVLVFDRVRHSIKIISMAESGNGVSPEDAYRSACRRIESIESKLRSPLDMPPVPLEFGGQDVQFDSNMSRDKFCTMVSKAKNFILEGDIIQTVLSQRFSMPFTGSPLSVHRALRTLNPSPYMFLLNCGDFSIVGASPEVHVRCIDGKITVRPIAGTRKRGANDSEDAKLAEDLLSDEKERAEHIMLVDLARNDIGRVSESGMVKVDELMIVEKYSHVMHIVSNVTGQLRPELRNDSVMRSTFPAGTLSGAPKIRAMQIISELENERRGPYGGAVAYYAFGGNLDSCITIRTAVLKDGKAYIQSGAGIVADSVPESEFEETVNKAKAMLKAVSASGNFKD